MVDILTVKVILSHLFLIPPSRIFFIFIQSPSRLSPAQEEDGEHEGFWRF